MSGYIESEAVFRQKGIEIGLSAADVLSSAVASCMQAGATSWNPALKVRYSLPVLGSRGWDLSWPIRVCDFQNSIASVF